MRARHVLIVPILVAVAVVALLGSGCSSVKASLDAKFTPKPRIVTQEATVAAVGVPIDGTVSAGFPESLPLWPGSRLTRKKVTKTSQGNSYSETFTTVDPYSDVLAGLEAGLTKAGFKFTATDGSTGALKVGIVMVSDAKLEGILTVSQLPKKPVIVQYIVTPKAKHKKK